MSGESAAKATAKDWHSSKHIAKRALLLLDHPDEEIPSDVTFLVGDGENEPQKLFKCHKFLLAMVSSMFQAMFYGAFPETDDIIKIPDVTPTAFQYMLRYAYGENVKLDDESLEDTLDILYCSKKYLIAKLARTCRDYIQLQIAIFYKDPCVVFQRAPQIDEQDLATLALREVARSAQDVLEGDEFPRLSFDCVKTIVDCPHLNATEQEIYQGVRRWAEHNVGVGTGNALRTAFGLLLYSIRFSLFSATELADGPVKDGVLSGDEASSVFQFLFAQTKPALPFLTTARSRLAGNLYCGFDLVSEHTVYKLRVLEVCADLAPASSAFLQQLVKDKLHIRIASYDNEHSGKTVPLPAAVSGERNILSHSVKSACWFEWDVEDGVACNVRIGVAKKPHRYHSAVFGFVLDVENPRGGLPFDSWGNKGVKGVANFLIS